MLKKLFMKRLGKNQKGVTLVELMAVVVILGVIAGVAGAAVTGAFKNSKENADKATHQILVEAAQRYLLQETSITLPTGTSTGTIDIATLKDKGYITNVPTPQSSSATSFTISFDKDLKVTVSP